MNRSSLARWSATNTVGWFCYVRGPDAIIVELAAQIG
jgi:hypothetical protein